MRLQLSVHPVLRHVYREESGFTRLATTRYLASVLEMTSFWDDVDSHPTRCFIVKQLFEGAVRYSPQVEDLLPRSWSQAGIDWPALLAKHIHGLIPSSIPGTIPGIPRYDEVWEPMSVYVHWLFFLRSPSEAICCFSEVDGPRMPPWRSGRDTVNDQQLQEEQSDQEPQRPSSQSILLGEAGH